MVGRQFRGAVRSYARFFDVRQVDLVLPRSGIGNGFPLACTSTAAGRRACSTPTTVRVPRWVGPAAGPRYAIALADSTDYGGAGGTGVTTLSAGSADAACIIEREMGHTVGGLGDEYDSAPGNADFSNLSAQDADAMTAAHAKWWRWLGAIDPSGGVVGAYQSANGLYRPTQDSIMRTLSGVYNLPAGRRSSSRSIGSFGPWTAPIPRRRRARPARADAPRRAAAARRRSPTVRQLDGGRSPGAVGRTAGGWPGTGHQRVGTGL
jgi:hypothetical protein